MASWQSWASVAVLAQEEAHALGGEEMVVCAHCGEVRPLSQMTTYGDRYVAIEHKDAFVQSLAEGAALPNLAGADQLQPVGFWWRFLASVIDSFCLMIPGCILALPVYFITMGGSKAVGETEMILVQSVNQIMNLVLNAFYEGILTGKYGGTVGKLVLGFKVVRVDGSPLGYGHAFGRWAAKALNGLIYASPFYLMIFLNLNQDDIVVGASLSMATLVTGIGFYMAGWTKRRQALHDFMAKTLVVKKNPS